MTARPDTPTRRLLADVLDGHTDVPLNPEQLAELIDEAGVMRQQALAGRLNAHQALAGDPAAAARLWEAAIDILAQRKGWDS